MHCSTLALLLVVILAAFLAYRRGIYTADGAAAGVAVYAAASLAGTVWAVLTALYVVASILLSGYGAEVKASRLGRLQGRAYHTWRHLAGRLGWGMVLVILVQLQHTDVLDYAFVGVIATALADVAATELGTLSAQPPRRLSDGVATSYGAPGAVSQIGLVAAAAGSWLAGLAALVGFKPFHELSATLQHYPEIATFIGGPATELVAGSENPAPDVSSRLTHALFAALIRRALEEPNALATTVDALAQRLSANVGGLTETELWFLELCQQYGNRDVGVFTLFLLNLVHLRPGEGIFTNAGVPHAYLRGNIVECMANSDNVVRVGLTPKYKDAETLLRIADTTPQQPQILEGDACTLREGVTAATYRTPAPEFEVRRWRLAPGTEHILDKGSGPAILLVTAGAVELAWDGGHADYRQGDSAFLPACLAECTVHAKDDSELFLARVPEGRR